MTNNISLIAKNTILLYLRMLLTMGVSLYTSRVILNALGIEDYGIYNIVGGLVAIFSILSTSLSTAISRFITFELGKGNINKLKRIFCTSVNIHIILIVIITVLMETIGIWFLNNKMVIPEERLAAANWVFQFSVISFALNLLCVPYNAVIIAHEKMSAFAYISIVGCILNLIVAIIITYNPFDRLVYYGLMVMICGMINRSIYKIYSKRHFEETTYRMIFDKELMKEMFGFAGWNFIGVSSVILRDEGGNLLINLFFGPIANAARGIAMQVTSAVSSFTNNFMTAVNPQITKSYASGDRDYMMKLIFQSTKFSFYLILLIAQPVLLATSYLLELWLGQVPDYSVNFIRLSMILILCDSLSHAITTAASATGNIKKYQLVVGGCHSLNFPLSYLCLYLGAQPESVFVVSIAVSMVCNALRIIITKNLVDLPVSRFLHDVGLRVLAVTAVSISILAVLHLYFENTFVYFLAFSAIATVCLAITVYCFGCSKSDRSFLKLQLQRLKGKFIR